MSSSRRAAAAKAAPSIGWMLAMSSWMLLTLVPGAMLTWLGFSIIGVASRSRRLLILAVVWGAAAILVSLDIWGQWRPLVGAVAYLSGMLVALMVNPGWLRTMWQRRLDREAQASTTSRTRGRTWDRSEAQASISSTTKARTAAKPSSRRARKAAAGVQTAVASAASPSKASKASASKARAKAAADAAAKAEAEARDAAAARAERDATAALATAAGASTDGLLAADEPVTEPVDVNTATVAELERLPGITRARARRAVAERETRGGFTSVENFGESVGLQPHEIVRLRRVATCSPRPRGERRFGRRVDY